MKQQSALYWLVPLVAVLALVTSGAGLFWQHGGSPSLFNTLYGQTVQIYGQGLYYRDTVFSAGASQGGDVAALFVTLPLFIVSLMLYRRGSLGGGFLLASALAYYLYYSASLALIAAYNNLYLVYLALFSTSFFGFVLALSAIELPSLPGRFASGLPRRGLAIFMFVVGIGVAFIWLSDVVTAVTTNGVPEALGANISLITYTIDVGIIVPACILAGFLLLRGAPVGYLLTGVLTILLTLVGAMVVAQTIMQLRLGLQFGIGQIIGKVGTWIILGGIALWLTISFLRSLSEPASAVHVHAGGRNAPDLAR